MFDLAATCPIDILCGVNDRNTLLQGLGYSRVLTGAVIYSQTRGCCYHKGEGGIGK